VRLTFESGFFPGPMVTSSSMINHKYGMQIVCFDEAPDPSDHEGKIYEAKAVISEIKAKYNLK